VAAQLVLAAQTEKSLVQANRAPLGCVEQGEGRVTQVVSVETIWDVAEKPRVARTPPAAIRWPPRDFADGCRHATCDRCKRSGGWSLANWYNKDCNRMN
jgi:hypothetical protein